MKRISIPINLCLFIELLKSIAEKLVVTEDPDQSRWLFIKNKMILSKRDVSNNFHNELHIHKSSA